MTLKIAVLRGGPSSEYEISLKSGKSVIETLKDEYKISDIVIDMCGDWYKNGVCLSPAEALRDVDVVFNAMHGEYGEDGKCQQILEQLGVNFTGPRALGAAISMNKSKTKDIYKDYGLKTPMWLVATKVDDIEIQARDILKQLMLPMILKPLDKGSSVGIVIIKSYQDLVHTLRSLYESVNSVLVEEYIQGKEGTVGVVEAFRNQEIYPLFPVEIIPPAHKEFFDYECKYDGTTKEICPGSFSREESETMQRAAISAHRALGLKHYSRSDFIVHPRRGVFIIETNSLPGLTNESLLPKSFEAVGSNYKEFLKHVIELAMNKK